MQSGGAYRKEGALEGGVKALKSSRPCLLTWISRLECSNVPQRADQAQADQQQDIPASCSI